MPSVRRKRAQNKKYYIQNIKELKTKAKSNYSANPEKKKAASKAALKLASYRFCDLTNIQTYGQLVHPEFFRRK